MKLPEWPLGDNNWLLLVDVAFRFGCWGLTLNRAVPCAPIGQLIIEECEKSPKLSSTMFKTEDIDKPHCSRLQCMVVIKVWQESFAHRLNPASSA